MPRSPILKLSSLAVLALASRGLFAQPPIAPVPPGTMVEFAQEPFRLESVGLTMLLPVGVTAQSTTIGGKATVQIQPDDAGWLINLQTPRTASPETTAAQAADEIVTQVIREAGEAWTKDASDPKRPKGVLVGYVGEIIEPRKTIIVGGLPAESVYARIPTSSGTVIRGFTIFKPSPAQFVTFELVVPETGFARAKNIFETTVGTATFEDPARIGLERAGAIKAGLKIMERLDESAIRTIIDTHPERWERLYRPAVTGADQDATELGYRRVRLSVGTRAALDPAGGSGAGSRDPGFVAAMDARFLDRARMDGSKLVAGRVIDSQSVFFLSLDRSTEAWTVRNAVRAGTPDGRSQPKVFTETGGRTGSSLFVSITAPNDPGRAVRPVMQGDGYVSRFESLILPDILIRAQVVADFGFYTYQSDSEAIKLRRDVMEQPADVPGLWRLSTRLSEDKRPQVSVFNAKGDLVRTELPDGSVWEPISIDRLVRLWQSKGLPMN
jgi:hypothetical protein